MGKIILNIVGISYEPQNESMIELIRMPSNIFEN